MLRRLFPLVMTAALVVGGCAQVDDAAGEETTTTAAPTTTTTAAPTTTTTAAPTTAAPTTTGLPASVSYGPSTLVTGIEECELSPPLSAGTETVDSDGTLHIRDSAIRCTVTNSDPRIAGTAVITGHADRWTTGTDGVQVQWGTIRIENEGGAWEAEYVGIYSPETGDIGAELFTGTGDYDGLYYYQWVFGTQPGQPWPTQGLIFPTTVPLP